MVYSDVIDPHVWDSVCKLITNPDILISYIEEEHDKFKRGELTKQMTYIDRQLKKCQQEEQQWDRAYAAGIFSLEEYGDKKKAVTARKEALDEEWEKISEEMSLIELFEKRRGLIYEHLAMLKEAGFALDIPFKEKRKIVAMLIDRVVIDSQNGWYRLEGAIEGTYQYGEKVASNGEDDVADFRYTSAP
jgi:hypothetical protein